MVFPKAILIACVCAALSAQSAAAEPAVTQTKLNLRSGPGAAFGVIAMLRPGTRLDVQRCHGTWCRVKAGPQTGYTSRAYLSFGSDSYAAAAADVVPPPPEPQHAAVASPRGPRIWQWRDAEWRDSHWRTFGWRNRHAGR